MRSGRQERRGFTLVELLVVVSIIALLVSILLPVLSNARAIARKAACAVQLNGHGKVLAQYMSQYNSYPFFGSGGISIIGAAWPRNAAWPKFYGVMDYQRIKGTNKTNYGTSAYIWTRKEVWTGGLCPAQDQTAIWNLIEGAYASGRMYVGKAWMHPAAIGYSWNPCLRAKNPGTRRWPAEVTDSNWCGNNDDTIWMNWVLSLPGGDYGAQAVNINEVFMPGRVMEAMDSCDKETAPNADIYGDWSLECLVPGWHIGPYSTGGWAVLNANRHRGSPNILYADGHVSSDADRPLPGAVLGTATFSGAKVSTWSDFDTQFGTMVHVVPNPKMGVTPVP